MKRKRQSHGCHIASPPSLPLLLRARLLFRIRPSSALRGLAPPRDEAPPDKPLAAGVPAHFELAQVQHREALAGPRGGEHVAQLVLAEAVLGDGVRGPVARRVPAVVREEVPDRQDAARAQPRDELRRRELRVGKVVEPSAHGRDVEVVVGRAGEVCCRRGGGGGVGGQVALDGVPLVALGCCVGLVSCGRGDYESGVVCLRYGLGRSAAYIFLGSFVVDLDHLR